MTKPTKHKVGRFLLFSLVPAAILFFFSFAFDVLTNTEGGAALAAVLIMYAILVAPVGLTLLIWGNVEFSRAYRASMQYAERNGWRPISRTAWRNRKRDNAALSVKQAYKKQTYLLQIEAQGDTITVEEFESSLWALQFGDWLWRELLQVNLNPDREDIEEKRAEWETALVERTY